MILEMTILEFVCQIWMLVFSSLAIFFVAKDNEWARWGFIFGVIGQPAWLIMAIYTHQWGMFILTIFYTLNWCKGVYNHWIKNTKK